MSDHYGGGDNETCERCRGEFHWNDGYCPCSKDPYFVFASHLVRGFREQGEVARAIRSLFPEEIEKIKAFNAKHAKTA